MSSPFTIPEKGSPLDVAREITSNEEVLDAIEELISTVGFVAKKYEVTAIETKLATEEINDLRAIIDAAIESGYEAALQRRNK